MRFMANTKHILLEELRTLSQGFQWDEELDPFTAGTLASRLGISRNVASQYLNEAHAQGELIKINTRPVYFFHREALMERLEATLSESAYASVAEMRRKLEREEPLGTFQGLVGYTGSLAYCIEQCKAAVTYPNGGLPILLQGPTGTGKSMIAQCMFDYAVKSGIIGPKGRFMHVNCSEYANNPELLVTNLFGHKKGAYTGADQDNKGLIALADGGMLFLDEIHCLGAESQEKLFQFMDKGTYHMVGDNDSWYRSSVQMVFATTEEPGAVLIRTLLRRIPIIAYVPALQDRPICEKQELIYRVLHQESQSLNRPVQMGSSAYVLLMKSVFSGNIGEMVNCIKASLARALLRSAREQEVTIRLYDLPNDIIEEAAKTLQLYQGDPQDAMSLSSLRRLVQVENRFYLFLRWMLEQYRDFQDRKMDLDSLAASVYKRLMNLYGDEGQSANWRAVSVVGSICNDIARRHATEKLPTSKIQLLTRFLVDYDQNGIFCTDLTRENRKALDECANILRDRFPQSNRIAADIARQAEEQLGIAIEPIATLVLSILMRSFRLDITSGHTAGLILAFGFSTASSVAETTNQMLHNYIFDAIDIPAESSLAVVVEKLVDYIGRMDRHRELVIVTDVCSLQRLSDILKNIEHQNIAVVDTLSTRLTLEIGRMIAQNIPLDEMLPRLEQHGGFESRLLGTYARPQGYINVNVSDH